MYRHTTKHKETQARHNDYDLYSDLMRIKDAFTDTAKNVRGQATDRFNQSFENVKAKSVDLQDNMANYTKEKPLKSLGLALLAGVVIGYILHRK